MACPLPPEVIPAKPGKHEKSRYFLFIACSGRQVVGRAFSKEPCVAYHAPLLYFPQLPEATCFSDARRSLLEPLWLFITIADITVLFLPQ